MGAKLGTHSSTVQMIGKSFAYLTVLSRAPRPSQVKATAAYWYCRCVCNNICVVQGGALRLGRPKSCGCKTAQLALEGAYKQKGHRFGNKKGQPEYYLYQIWQAFRERCRNPKNKNYHQYGGRGIRVCKSWEDNPESFVEWALANGYDRGLELDRRDNNGNYEPSNCRFVTHKENCNNRRPKSEWGKAAGARP